MRNAEPAKHIEYADNAVSGAQVHVVKNIKQSILTRVLPWRAGFWRTAVETLLGWLVLAAIAGSRMPDAAHRSIFLASFHSPWSVLTLLSWMWVVAWPAWRLRPLQGGRWWSRPAKGVGRVWLLALVIGIACVGVADAVNLGAGATLDTAHGRAFGYVFSLVFLVTMLRTALNAAVAIRRWTRTRLRRQLMVSHLLVIMMTFVGLVGVGAITALFLAINNLPSPTSQARALAKTLAPEPGEHD